MPYLSFIITNKPTNCIVSFYHKWHAKTYLNQHPPSSTRCYLTKSRTTTPVQRSQNLKTWLAQPAQTRRSYRPAVQTFQRKWVNSSAWPSNCCFVFMLLVRTNNDIEGWQHSLNRRSGNKVHLPFYLLVELLDQESHLVSIHIRLVSDGKLSRIQRKKYWQLQERVFKHWEDFNFKEISARRLLKLCSYLNGPVGRSEDAPIYLP